MLTAPQPNRTNILHNILSFCSCNTIYLIVSEEFMVSTLNLNLVQEKSKWTCTRHGLITGHGLLKNSQFQYYKNFPL